VTEHLTDAELHAFAGGLSAADELLRADDHLSACGRCRARAIALNDIAPPLDDLRAQLNTDVSHLTDEDVQLFVQDRLTTPASAVALAHLKDCSTCARHLEDLRSWAEAGEPVRPRRAPRFLSVRRGSLALAATILLAILIPAAIRQARSGRPTASASVVGLETLPPLEQERVRTALNAGAATIPDFMSDLATSREVLMGAPARSETFGLVAPIGTATVTDRPRFEWQVFDRAEHYVVTVFDEQSTVVARSPMITETYWMPVDPLARGRTYVWQVAAQRASSMITAPAAPAPPAKFHVIDASSADVLERVEAERPQAHLLLGILYMQAGILDAAKRHLQQVQPMEAYAQVAQRSLERLQR
jgi:hypothetical protein